MHVTTIHDRVCELFVLPCHRYGSGVLIAPGLILTSQHLFGQTQTETETEAIASLSIRIGIDLKEATWEDATLIWSSVALDAALVAPATGQRHFQGARNLPPLRFGHLGQQPLACRVLGFPRAADRPDLKFNDSVDLAATIRPLAFRREGVVGLEVTSPPPSDRRDWQGLSGGPVFHEQALVGIILQFTLTFGPELLKVRAMTDLLQQEEFCTFLEAALGQEVAAVTDVLATTTVPVTWALITALSQQYDLCLEHQVPVMTFHKLLLLFRVAPSYTNQCFEAVKPGLAAKIHSWLVRQVEKQLAAPGSSNLTGNAPDADPTLVAAGQMALADSAAAVDARHFMMALLTDESSITIQKLRQALNEIREDGFEQLQHTAKILSTTAEMNDSNVSSFEF